MVTIYRGDGNSCGYGLYESAKISGPEQFSQSLLDLWLSPNVDAVGVDNVQVMIAPLTYLPHTHTHTRALFFSPMTVKPHTWCTNHLSAASGLGNAWQSGSTNVAHKGNGDRAPQTSPPQCC